MSQYFEAGPSRPLLSRLAIHDYETVLSELRSGKMSLISSLPQSESIVAPKEFDGSDWGRVGRQCLSRYFPDYILAHAILIKWNLSGTKFKGFELAESEFIDCNLQVCRLDDTYVINGRLSGSDCSLSSWKMAQAGGSECEGVDFSGADLTGADFSGADLTGARFCGARLTGIDLTGANLSQCDFTLADMTDAVLSRSTLANTNFMFANMEKCRFTPVDFRAGNYHGVTLVDGQEPHDWPKVAPTVPESQIRDAVKPILWYRDHPRVTRAKLAFGHLDRILKNTAAILTMATFGG